MTMDSRIPGFYRKSVSERIDALVSLSAIRQEDADTLKGGQALLPPALADRLIENVIGSYGLPFAVAPNFQVNGEDFLVPMVVEEPSIVAGLSGAARLMRRSGGFRVTAAESLLAGQIQLVDIESAEQTIDLLRSEAAGLLASANAELPKLTARGGGCRDIEFYAFELPDGRPTVVLHVLVDTCDAMGANMVNTVCERLAPRIESIAGGRVVLRILSNLVDRALVTARVNVPLDGLRAKGFEPEAVRDAIVMATDVANLSPHRAATHNKGIMNGIDAVALATGNDWRAIEASAHAYAVREGAYRSLSRWSVADNGDLSGELKIPLKVGIVGGSLQANPGARIGLQIAGVDSAAELAALMASVGLAQNFAALRALVTHGIQRGHMRLHARSVAATAGVAPEHFDKVVAAMIESGEVKTWKAEEISRTMSSARDPRLDFRDAAGGAAAGKVILLGEHAAVYDKHVVALPLHEAVVARVIEGGDGIHVTLAERGAEHPFTVERPGHTSVGIGATLNLILDRLGVATENLAIRVESRIPAAMGLGSSAAFAVAIIRALDKHFSVGLTDRQVDELAFDCEKLAHGTPSGIDNTLATFGRAVLFNKSNNPRTKAIELAERPPIVVASSGIRGVTKDQVAGVRARYDRNPGRYASIFNEIDDISLAGAAALREADYATLGSLMNVCHGLLNAIEVSVPELEAMIQTARKNGAVGAKLTGSGGGGSIVALCPGCEDEVAAALEKSGQTIIRLGSGEQQQ